MEFRTEFFPVTVDRDEENCRYVFQTAHPEYEMERKAIEEALEKSHEWRPKPTKENPEPEMSYRKFPSEYLPVTIEWNERGREYRLTSIHHPKLRRTAYITLEDGFLSLANLLDHAVWVNSGEAAPFIEQWRRHLPSTVIADDEDFVRFADSE